MVSIEPACATMPPVPAPAAAAAPSSPSSAPSALPSSCRVSWLRLRSARTLATAPYFASAPFIVSSPDPFGNPVTCTERAHAGSASGVGYSRFTPSRDSLNASESVAASASRSFSTSPSTSFLSRGNSTRLASGTQPSASRASDCRYVSNG